MRPMSFFAALTLVAMSSTSLFAQSRPSLEIIIEALDADAARCNITEPLIRTSATLTLRNNRISVSKGTGPFLYIYVISLYLPKFDSCTFSASTSIRTSQFARERNGLKTNNFENVLLCHKTGIAVGPRTGIPKQVSEMVADYVSACLVDIEY
jgi:hypothetical protein